MTAGINAPTRSYYNTSELWFRVQALKGALGNDHQRFFKIRFPTFKLQQLSNAPSMVPHKW